MLKKEPTQEDVRRIMQECNNLDGGMQGDGEAMDADFRTSVEGRVGLEGFLMWITTHDTVAGDGHALQDTAPGNSNAKKGKIKLKKKPSKSKVKKTKVAPA